MFTKKVYLNYVTNRIILHHMYIHHTRHTIIHIVHPLSFVGPLKSSTSNIKVIFSFKLLYSRCLLKNYVVYEEP